MESATIKWMTDEPKVIPQVANLGIKELVRGLHGCNFYSWKADDRSRGDLDPQVIVRYKRDLDASNLMRNHFMEAIDTLCVSSLQLEIKCDLSGFILNSETLGQMLDRLSVLTLKQIFSQDRLESNDERKVAAGTLSLQRGYVAECYDQFLRLLSEKKAYMLAYKQFKMYRPDE